MTYCRETSYRLETYVSLDSEEQNEKQREAFEEFKAELEYGLRFRDLDVPVLFGTVRSPPEARVTRAIDAN